MSPLASARVLLVRPRRFFERRGSRPKLALVAVAVVTLAVFVAAWSVFELFMARIDGTVMVDNPAYPGDAFCRGPGDPIAGDCDAPKQVERDIDTVIAEVRGEFLGFALVVSVVAWLFNGLLLHVGSWLAGNEGSVVDSFAVAAWGLIPTVFSVVTAVTVLWLTFDPITVTPEDTPEQFLDVASTQLGTLTTVGIPLQIASVLWSAYIHIGGLVATRGVPRSRAVFIAGIVAVLALAGTL